MLIRRRCVLISVSARGNWSRIRNRNVMLPNTVSVNDNVRYVEHRCVLESTQPSTPHRRHPHQSLPIEVVRPCCTRLDRMVYITYLQSQLVLKSWHRHMAHSFFGKNISCSLKPRRVLKRAILVVLTQWSPWGA
jgi:hypothetical protein